MIDSRNLDQPCVGNSGRQLATAFDAHQGIARQVDNQGWNLYGMKNSGNVDLTIHAHQRDCS